LYHATRARPAVKLAGAADRGSVGASAEVARMAPERARAAVVLVLVLLGAAPSPRDVLQPPAQVLATGQAATPVGKTTCVRAFAAAEVKGRALAEDNADGIALRLGGVPGKTLRSSSTVLQPALRVLGDEPAPPCEGGSAAASVTVLRAASIPVPPAPSDADRARDATLYSAPLGSPGTLYLDEPVVYAAASVSGADDRIAARLAADRARRAAADLGKEIYGVAGVVSFTPTGSNMGAYTQPVRFFFPPETTSIGIALRLARGGVAGFERDLRVRLAVPRPYRDTIAAPFDIVQRMRAITVETDIPADRIVVTVYSGGRSSEIAAELRRAGIDARATSEFMYQPTRGSAEASAPPDEAAVQALLARVRALYPDGTGTSVVTRPELSSCQAAEDRLRRAAFAILDARGPLYVALGPLSFTTGWCGISEYSPSTTLSSISFSVTARLTVAVMP
jgi:hypothetical protein